MQTKAPRPITAWGRSPRGPGRPRLGNSPVKSTTKRLPKGTKLSPEEFCRATLEEAKRYSSYYLMTDLDNKRDPSIAESIALDAVFSASKSYDETKSSPMTWVIWKIRSRVANYKIKLRTEPVVSRPKFKNITGKSLRFSVGQHFLHHSNSWHDGQEIENLARDPHPGPSEIAEKSDLVESLVKFLDNEDEKEVIRLLSLGHTCKDIGKRFKIGPKNVERITRKLCEKMKEKGIEAGD